MCLHSDTLNSIKLPERPGVLERFRVVLLKNIIVICSITIAQDWKQRIVAFLPKK